MCGRYSLTATVDGLRTLFDFRELPNLPPRYNIAPTQAVLAVLRGDGLKDQNGHDLDVGPRAAILRWGLVPSWAKDTSIAAKMINARAETVAEKPAFKKAFQRRRCLLPADGFYEWQTIDGKKQAFRIRFADGEPFAFAGLWERWMDAQGNELETCAIVTTDAAPAIAEIHHRMPVILDPDRFSTWLGGGMDAAQALLRPYGGSRTLESFPVDRRVNDVRNDDKDLLAPIELDRAPPTDKRGQMSLF